MTSLRWYAAIFICSCGLSMSCADTAPVVGGAGNGDPLIDNNTGANNGVNNSPNNGGNNAPNNEANNAPNNEANNSPNNEANNAPNNEANNGAPGDECDPSSRELCDGFDNNCNGEVDEGCTCTVAEKSCYSGPPSTMGVGGCRAGVQQCMVEFYGPCEGEILPGIELCDGIDNDCDGQIDETFPEVGSACSVGQGGCDAQGLMLCGTDGASTYCNAVPVEPGDEICDGLDNDCDGEFDEDFPDLGQDCEVGLGECLNQGRVVCAEEGAATTCSAQPRATRAELCDDLDNDCDGQVDEAFPGLGETCDSGLGECAVPGTTVCSPDGDVALCDSEPGPEQPEVCDGLDNNCDGQIDELPECTNGGPAVVCPAEITLDVLQTAQLTAIATDPNDDPLTVRWSLDSAPLGSTTVPTPVNQRSTELFLDLAGDFVMTFTAVDPQDQSASCSTRIRAVPSERLRVELVWNVGVNNDPSDVDLHLLRTGSGGSWFDNRWDCYWSNCNASGGQDLPWGAPGSEDNPRLDLDDVEGNGPENINIDFPEQRTYRLGVHYFDDDGSGDATAIVRIYCNGQPFREFEPVVLSADGASFNNDFWIVADIQWTGNTCVISEFGTPGNRDIRRRSDL